MKKLVMVLEVEFVESIEWIHWTKEHGYGRYLTCPTSNHVERIRFTVEQLVDQMTRHCSGLPCAPTVNVIAQGGVA